MIHAFLYIVHVIGMAVIVSTSINLLVQKNLSTDKKKKFARYVMSAAHTQLVSGFLLFLTVMTQVNHAKIGIKMLLGLEIALLASIYKRKITEDKKPHPSILILLVASSLLVTSIAFLWK